ncbi:MAG: DUF4910 domain-containing protein [Terriglobia bacterium]
MQRRVLLLVCLTLMAIPAAAQTYAPPDYLVSDELFQAVAQEFSGAIAKENVRGIIQFHRIQASPGFSRARAWVVNQLREIGVTDVEVETFVSDGKTRYQTYVSPMAWTVREGELWVEAPFQERFCRYSEVPMCLTTLSNGGDWRGKLVHVGQGTNAADYEGKEVQGKIVLATGYAAQVHRQAVIERGALGVLIYPAADDRPEHPHMVRYNGLWPSAEERDRVGFGFQLSRRQADRLLAALRSGETVRLHALVDAEIHPGQLEVTSAFFRPSTALRTSGTDPSTSLGAGQPEKEIILVAHLDHPKFSANDNASGSGALLEVARTLKRLTDSGKVSLRRTIRLMWVPEHMGTIAWLSKHRDIGTRALAVLNLDMVGENIYQTNSVTRITRTPDSLPSFLNDLVENVAEQVEAANLVEPSGSRNLFHWTMRPYEPGSDHDMFNDGTIGVPAVMFYHWPDWTHHTSQDTIDKVDPTTLKRVGVMATATALWLVTLENADNFMRAFDTRRLRKNMQAVTVWEIVKQLDEPKASKPRHPTVEIIVREKVVARRLFLGPLADSYASPWFREELGADYAWWEEQAGEVPLWGVLVYETLNFTDGKRSLAEIEDAVRAEFGEVPEGLVEHILRDLEKVGLVEFSAPKADQ